MALTDKLTDIADAIREKTGTKTKIKLDEMDDVIRRMDTKFPSYSGSYNIEPSFEKQTLSTKEVSMHADVNVEPITVMEISNSSDGYTLII